MSVLLRSLLWGVIFVLPASVTSAANLRFLESSLLSQLSSSEVSALKQEIGDVLNQQPDQEIINWRSPETAIQVQIKPKLSFNEGTSECRRTLFNTNTLAVVLAYSLASASVSIPYLVWRGTKPQSPGESD